MQCRMDFRKTLLVLGLTLPVQTGLGQSAGPILVDIAPCVGLANAIERLDCYDRLGRDAATPETAAAGEVAPAAPEVAEFGRNTPAADARVLVNPDGEQELLDEIVELRERVPGRWLITLASGQVWYQDNSQRMRLRKGMQVRIYPSPLGGSWRMARADGEQSGFVQVSRIE